MNGENWKLHQKIHHSSNNRGRDERTFIKTYLKHTIPHQTKFCSKIRSQMRTRQWLWSYLTALYNSRWCKSQWTCTVVENFLYFALLSNLYLVPFQADCAESWEKRTAMEFLEQIRDASPNKSMSLSEILLDGFSELEEDVDNPVEEVDISPEDENVLNSTITISTPSSLLSLSTETNNALRQFFEFVDMSTAAVLKNWELPGTGVNLRLSESPSGDESDLLPRLNNASNACLILTSTLISIVETDYDADISSSSVEIDDMMTFRTVVPGLPTSSISSHSARISPTNSETRSLEICLLSRESFKCRSYSVTTLCWTVRCLLYCR